MKILYLMHVDWNWIKQRPHFIAEYLNEKGYEVDVYYQRYGRNDLVNNKSCINVINKIPQLRGSRFSIIRKLNRVLYALFVKKLQKKIKYDYVFITHPSMYANTIKGKLIYDCMDDNAAFSMNVVQRKIVLSMESKILQQAELVIFSSDYLKNIVLKRSNNLIKHCCVINNAIHLPNIDMKSLTKNNKNDDGINIVYIGTISDWFDFDMLNEVKNRYPQKINFNLYGPVDLKNRQVPVFVNIMGAVNHSEIFNIMNNADILIMPFIVNELIKSVNPVKLYEYIYSGKPIICVRYGESEKFSDQVYLYDNQNSDSFIEQLDLIVRNDFRGKLSQEESFEYVKTNTWESRVNTLIEYL